MMKLFYILSLFLFSGPLFAFGPNNVTSDGTVVKWSGGAVTYHLESDLDVRGKDVSSFVSIAAGVWTAASHTSLAITEGALGAAVDNDNKCSYVFDATACPSGPLSDGLNPMIFDDDGSITNAFFGAQFSVLGFAGLVSFNATTGAAIKGEGIFNGACLAGVELAGCTSGGSSFSFDDDDLTAIIVHEIGHFLGINHVDIGLESSSTAQATMYPFFTAGTGGNVKTLQMDDEVAAAFMYPASSFLANKVKVTGRVIDKNGVTGFQCANVVATSSTTDRVAFVSGMLKSGKAFNGEYQLYLTPDTSYTITAQSIPANFSAASGIVPCNGATGNGTAVVFTAKAYASSVSGVAGALVADINIVLTDGTNVAGDPSTSDMDGDEVVDISDNCPNDANADQADTDDDGIGTVCDDDEVEVTDSGACALTLVPHDFRRYQAFSPPHLPRKMTWAEYGYSLKSRFLQYFSR